MLLVAKKTIFDLLAKALQNQYLKQLVEALQEVMLKNDQLVKTFMLILSQDDFEYVFDVLLDCIDTTSRLYIGQLMKFLLNRLKVIEREHLKPLEEGQEQKSLCAKYILTALSLLKSKAAKNWTRFENFLDTIYSFAVDSFHDQFLRTPHNIDLL